MTNNGAVPVTVTALTAQAKGNSSNHLVVASLIQATPQGLPITLDRGAQWSGLINDKDVRDGAKGLVPSGPPWKVRFVVGDATDRKHSSNRLRLIE